MKKNAKQPKGQKAVNLAHHPPPRSGLVQLVSMLTSVRTVLKNFTLADFYKDFQ
jgi:hypothetical protein